MAAKGGGGGGDGMPGALKYQTWTLKVPIHCEGCSRKVKRVLHSIDGVFTISVDSQQHKVEVTGDVDSETLIKKLTKSGKQAELWPEQKEKKSGKSKNKDNKQENPKDSEDAGEEAPKDVNGVEDDDDDDDDDGENQESENKETGSATKEAGAAGTGGKKKKKKKKGKKNNDGGAGDGAAASNASNTSNIPGTSSGFTPPIPGSMSMNPYPIYYPTQAPGMSYNAAYPSPSASYYGASPMHAYSYSHPGSAYTFPPPPADPIRTYGDNDHDYNDDNSGCSIM
ncbi:hypothetical protein BT93_K0874 [Corymbia citriodora subsp. variegata]|nr:hypothetical protein BT93_K0874 [Corymbia citriodora subsp. variegata]